MSRVSTRCMLCGARHPAGHVLVRNPADKIVGRICSAHALRDVILEPEGKFEVDVKTYREATVT